MLVSNSEPDDIEAALGINRECPRANARPQKQANKTVEATRWMASSGRWQGPSEQGGECDLECFLNTATPSEEAETEAKKRRLSSGG